MAFFFYKINIFFREKIYAHISLTYLVANRDSRRVFTRFHADISCTCLAADRDYVDCFRTCLAADRD
jgi:hypothetical protein